jgi:hypothetical protein
MAVSGQPHLPINLPLAKELQTPAEHDAEWGSVAMKTNILTSVTNKIPADHPVNSCLLSYNSMQNC